MTARANKLTERARSSDRGIRAGVVNVFVNALQRLGYDTDSLLANAGVVRSDLNNPASSHRLTVASLTRHRRATSIVVKFLISAIAPVCYEKL